MSTLRVWAPAASTVAAHLRAPTGDAAHTTVDLARSGNGWWSASTDVEGDYAFSLDGGEPLPDPRSQWQPEGVHGFSRAVDHAAYPWRAKGWRGRPFEGAVTYELHVGTFTGEGTFDAAADKLDHLVGLGVDFVEVMPVAAFPGRHGWGYDGVFPYAVHDAYGGPDAMKRFIDACHERDLGVVLDVVYNHLGPDGNVLPRYGPYFTGAYSTPWGEAVNYDGAGSDEVRRYVVDNAVMWLRDYRVDGLRLDAVHAIHDASARHILEQLAAEVRDLSARCGRTMFVIAESDLNDPRVITAATSGGYGVDGQWSDDFHHAVHAALTGERSGYYADFGSLADIARALRHGYVYDGRYSRFRDRTHGRPLPVPLSGHRLVGYSQNHDQIGNRARGERLGQIVSPGLHMVAAALVLTSTFTPMLFMGEEWAASTPWQYFTDHRDPKMADAVRSGRRAEFAAFGWDPALVPDPQDIATFERSKLDWSELDSSTHARMLGWYRALVALRHGRPALTSGDRGATEVRFDDDARWIAVRRGDVVVAANLASTARSVPIGDRGGEVLLASDDAWRLHGDAIVIGPESVAIVGLTGGPSG